MRISYAAARVNAKLTQKELADILQVSKTTINNWEQGATQPNITQVRHLSELSGIPMEYIF